MILSNTSIVKLLTMGMFLTFSVTVKAQQNKEEEKPQVKIGGALRYNYNLSSWKDGQKKTWRRFWF